MGVRGEESTEGKGCGVSETKEKGIGAGCEEKAEGMETWGDGDDGDDW